MNNSWTPESEKLLYDYYSTKGAAYCAHLLNRSITAVYKKANRLGLKGLASMTHEQYENKLFEQNIDYYPLESYKGCSEPIKHQCLLDHEWFAKPIHILARSSNCPVCSHGGEQETILYYIRITTKLGEIFYKIGITNESVKRRFDKDSDKLIEIIWQHTYATRIEARAVEYELLTLFKDKLIKNVNILKSGGNTELFYEDILVSA